MTREVVACVRRAEGLLVVLALVVAGCSEPSRPPARQPDTESPDVDNAPEQRGLATYYADSLAGNKTASGERYDPKELTAAHRTLPFGTVVDVSRSDGRTIRVRINDRGPFGNKKRIIDLSRRAAEEIGIVKEGVVPVTITIVKYGKKTKTK